MHYSESPALIAETLNADGKEVETQSSENRNNTNFISDRQSSIKEGRKGEVFTSPNIAWAPKDHSAEFPLSRSHYLSDDSDIVFADKVVPGNNSKEGRRNSNTNQNNSHERKCTIYIIPLNFFFQLVICNSNCTYLNCALCLALLSYGT